MSTMRQAPAQRSTLAALAVAVAEVGYTWAEKLYDMTRAKPKEQHLLDALISAQNYNDWWQAAAALDDAPDKYNWRVNPIDDQYDYKLIEERRKELFHLRRNENVISLASSLRQGLLRNLFNITRLPLYEKTYVATKDNITRYIEESVESIRYIAESMTAPTSGAGRLTPQEKLDILYDSRKSFGCTALLLQGGSIFGLSHLGVVKALLEHGILPKVVVGSATGAVMAALVGIHTLEELPEYLNGNRLDFSAFAAAAAAARKRTAELSPGSALQNWFGTLERRIYRLYEEGFWFDPQILEDCIADNIGDITFREAFVRSDRVLNIIISSPNEEIPTLLNHLTAPNVLVRSAAMVSHITNMSRMPKGGVQLLYKETDGTIRRMAFRPDSTGARPQVSATDPRKTPLARMRQQFNVDHFIISQARPYFAPFLKPSLPYLRTPGADVAWNKGLFSVPDFSGAIKHGLLLVDIFGWLPETLRRVLSDELVTGDSLTLVPEFNFNDYIRLLRNPTEDGINYWILRGERSVWPSLCALKVRCMIEMALDQAYERVRRRRVEGAQPDPFPMLLAQIQSRPMGPQRAMTSLGLRSDEMTEDVKRKTPHLVVDGIEAVEAHHNGMANDVDAGDGQ